MNKILYLAPISLFLLSNVYASTYTELQKEDLEKRITQLEYEQKTVKVINAPLNPCVKNMPSFFVEADLLWMTAREDGLMYANTIYTGNESPTSVDLNSLNIGKAWKAGFRFILGFCIPHDNWDIQLSWLRLHGSRSDEDTTTGSTAEPLDFITPEFTLTQNIYAETSCTWRSDIDLLDLELGRAFYISEELSLRPFISIRNVTTDQKIDNFYQNASQTMQNQTHMRCNYEAIGPRIGLNGKWAFTDSFSMFGNAAIAGVLGKFKVSEHDSPQNFILDHLSDNPFNHNDTYFSGKVISDLALGFRWAHNFKKDRYILSLSLAWENHVFFNFNEFPIWDLSDAGNYIDFKSHGDLSLQGIAIGLKLDF